MNRAENGWSVKGVKVVQVGQRVCGGAETGADYGVRCQRSLISVTVCASRCHSIRVGKAGVVSP